MIRRRPQNRVSGNASSEPQQQILPIYQTSNHEKRSGRSDVAAAVLVVIPMFISCVALIGWICVSGGLSTAQNKDRTTSVMRVSSNEYANITQFLPCIDDVSIPPYFSEIKPILKPHRKLSRSPSYGSLPCSPPDKNRCFRAVYDGFSDLLTTAGHKNLKDNRNVPPKGDLTRSKIQMLLQSLILHPETPITSKMQLNETEPSLLEPTVSRQKTYGIDEESKNYGQLHADYFESASYVYTAILYDDPPDDMLGGETALVNVIDLTKKASDGSSEEGVAFGMKIKENETVAILRGGDKASTSDAHTNKQLELTSGVIIEPKRGRLVLFSSGGENFHTPMEVKSGKRPTYHYWFKCKSKLQ